MTVKLGAYTVSHIDKIEQTPICGSNEFTQIGVCCAIFSN